MTRSVKGALLSGVIFPGLGQLWLKRYLLGATLIVAVCVAMALVLAKAAHQALAMVEKAEAEGGTVDLVAVLDAASRASSAASDATTKGAMAVVLLCWVVGVVDAYLAGKKGERV